MAQVKKSVSIPKSNTTVDSNNVVQLIYADAVIEIGIGPFVSRAMLGRELGPGRAAPIVQLVMPSNALLSFAQNVIRLFGKADTVEGMKGHFTKFQGEISLLDTTLIPPQKR